ncbi:MAG: hypothetical protein QM764_24460 [Chitinophagaceae bacterium]
MEIIFIATLMETALVAILLISFFSLRYFLSGKIKRNWFNKNKSLAGFKTEKAVILSIEPLVTTTSNSKTKILIKVMPQNGRNFVTELKEKSPLPALSELRSGSTIIVQYDESNTKAVTMVRANSF